jgi:hypothetical protein
MPTAEQTAKVLPFRVNFFKIPVHEFEKIYKHLEFAAFIINQDMPLDWEDRETACRQICDALCALRELRSQGEMKP